MSLFFARTDCLALAAFILAMIVIPRRQREEVASTIDQAVKPPHP
jgi:hypothetical protein